MIDQELIDHLRQLLPTWRLGDRLHDLHLILQETPDVPVFDAHQKCRRIDIIFEGWHEVARPKTSFVKLLSIRNQEGRRLERYLLA